ncbi:MAG: hypothetical protein AB8B86_12435 [Pseudomonadales bacterium]
MLSQIRKLIAPQRTLVLQKREIAQLKDELEKLKKQNDSMRDGMRRCTSCDYRIDFKKRQGK